MIRVVLAEDHAIVREGVKRLLSAATDIRVVGEAADGAAVLACCAETPADVLVLDVSMPGPGFVRVLAGVRATAPALRVLVLSAHAEEQYAVRALQEGAVGFISKERSANELVRAVRRVHTGGRYVSENLADLLARHVAGDAAAPAHDALSRREFEVLCQLGAGKTLKEIAVRLAISPKTVSTYRARLLEKLDLETTGDLVRYAVEHDLEASA